MNFANPSVELPVRIEAQPDQSQIPSGKLSALLSQPIAAGEDMLLLPVASLLPGQLERGPDFCPFLLRHDGEYIQAACVRKSPTVVVAGQEKRYLYSGGGQLDIPIVGYRIWREVLPN